MSCFTDKLPSGEVWQIAHPGGRHLNSSGSRQAVALSCFFTLHILKQTLGEKVYMEGNLDVNGLLCSNKMLRDLLEKNETWKFEG